MKSETIKITCNVLYRRDGTLVQTVLQSGPAEDELVWKSLRLTGERASTRLTAAAAQAFSRPARLFHEYTVTPMKLTTGGLPKR